MAKLYNTDVEAYGLHLPEAAEQLRISKYTNLPMQYCNTDTYGRSCYVLQTVSCVQRSGRSAVWLK